MTNCREILRLNSSTGAFGSSGSARTRGLSLIRFSGKSKCSYMRPLEHIYFNVQPSRRQCPTYAAQVFNISGGTVQLRRLRCPKKAEYAIEQIQGKTVDSFVANKNENSGFDIVFTDGTVLELYARELGWIVDMNLDK